MAAAVRGPSFDSSVNGADHGSESATSPMKDSELEVEAVSKLAGVDSNSLQETDVKSEFAADEAAAAPAKARAKLCCVCQADWAKYKCARCAQPLSVEAPPGQLIAVSE
jgi:hypothetical protein